MSGAREKVGFGGVPARLIGELPGLAPAMLLALMLACVLVPLPQWLVDLLLSGSLAFSVLLLVAATRVDRPSRFLVFPNLLLLVTAFRLVLNLATTRLILAEADAGRVIDAFASFVTRGDLVVGAVMFGIVTAIQYLVIARGTERVAEVAARFALDGMPGRQAAIAADLSSGAISVSEAARRRAELDERSDFYGAMDGAVKFVKHDAIVGLIIVGINLVGGLYMGVGRMGYGLSDAMETYGRLAIGDGLLAQLPAVLVSLAAGVLVSRIEGRSATRPTPWLEPPMLLVPAVLLLGVALIPGMPSLAFALVGIALVGAAWAATARELRTPEKGDGLRLRMATSAVAEPQRASITLESLRGQVEAATGLSLGELELELDPAARGVELWRGPQRLASGDGEIGASWIDAAYGLMTRNAGRMLSLGRVEAQLAQVSRRDGAATRVALSRVTLPELLALQRSFLDAALPLPALDTLVAALAEGEVFADREQRDAWPQRLREATVSAWLPAVLEAYGRVDSPSYHRCSPDLQLAIESCTRREAGRYRCTLSASTLDELRRAWFGGEGPGGIVLASTTELGVQSAFFGALRPRIPVLTFAEFAALGREEPIFAWLDDEPLESLLDAAA
jgi:type III secretion protein V